MSIAVQTAVGAIGSKATTELSHAFAGMVNCGAYQYGVNSSGIFRLNSTNLNNGAEFEKSFTLATSDFGSINAKRIRRLYVEIEIKRDMTLFVAIRPNKGQWITKQVSLTGAGLRKIDLTIQREGCSGNFHTIRLSSTGEFRVHRMDGLFNIRPTGVSGENRGLNDIAGTLTFSGSISA